MREPRTRQPPGCSNDFTTGGGVLVRGVAQPPRLTQVTVASADKRFVRCSPAVAPPSRWGQSPDPTVRLGSARSCSPSHLCAGAIPLSSRNARVHGRSAYRVASSWGSPRSPGRGLDGAAHARDSERIGGAVAYGYRQECARALRLTAAVGRSWVSSISLVSCGSHAVSELLASILVVVSFLLIALMLRRANARWDGCDRAVVTRRSLFAIGSADATPVNRSGSQRGDVAATGRSGYRAPLLRRRSGGLR